MAEQFISREAIGKGIYQTIQKAKADGLFSLEGAECSILGAIQKMEAADVQRIKHGTWVGSGPRYYCSCCDNLSGRTYRYCPHCGARMDGQDSD